MFSNDELLQLDKVSIPDIHKFFCLEFWLEDKLWLTVSIPPCVALLSIGSPWAYSELTNFNGLERTNITIVNNIGKSNCKFTKSIVWPKKYAFYIFHQK